jgi:signal transduction histidine kinase
MNLPELLAAVGLIAGCALLVWFRTGLGPAPKAAAGRLRETGWCAALLVTVLAAADTFQPGPTPGYPSTGESKANYAILLAVGVLLLLRPRLSFGLLPPGLMFLGGYGFVVARSHDFWVLTTEHYVFLRPGDYSMQYYLVLPVAYGLLVAGGGLAWYVMDRTSLSARLVLGRRLADRPRPAAAGTLLLLPVVAMAMQLVSPNVWFVSGASGLAWTAALVLAALLIIRQAPDTAAVLATAGLILLGLAGFKVAGSVTGIWPLPLSPVPGKVIYGAVLVTTPTMAEVAFAQSIVLIGLGLWLVPRTVPQVGRLLGRASNADLLQRVQRLTESRELAVDTAAADLRRLERDLHDGAQARLVALGMHLRAVEKLIPDRPAAALALVAEARETSARALTELRELVRGVHPPILADRGLGDAIQALALDSPMRVQSDIDLPARLPAPIETACYFAVAEVLTNAAKHSGAREARISAAHGGDVLRITVTDFGLGGADASRGSGLAGVERRLATFDGILALSSPPGGPTIVVMEIPCASPADQLSARRETGPGCPAGGPRPTPEVVAGP